MNFSRLHPLFVHLPIGILLFATVLVLWQVVKKTEEFEGAIRLALALSFLTALAAATTGWFLSEEGGYNADMLWRHKWSGISLTVLIGVLFFTHRTNYAFLQKVFIPLFMVAVGLLTFTGHQGGNLTHGVDYLFSRPEDNSIVVTNIEKAPIFPTFIEPILKAKCNSCHNPSKAKGDLIMTSQAGLLAGGSNGSIFNFDSPAMSELLQRIHLPLEEKKHMPPKGKKQITDDEAKLLLWWIENQACFNCIVDSSKNRASVAPILEKYKSVNTNISALKVDSVSEKMLSDLRQSGISISRLSSNNPFLIANFSGREDLNNSIFKKLKKVENNVVELNLSNSNFGDDLVSYLSTMSHLKKVQLQNTLITDEAIQSLEHLKYLESLNIYGTKVTGGSIRILKEIASLKNLFCWQTKILKSEIEVLQNERPMLSVLYKIDDSIFGSTRLNPPRIFVDRQIFNDSIAIKLKSEFEDTRIYYTLDGSEPDTLSSLYVDSFFLNRSATLKAMSELSGWSSSIIAERQFVHSKAQFLHGELSIAPAESYQSKGVESLFDFQKGSENFSDGNWLGWQGKHATATLELAEKQVIRKVYVSSISSPNSWIFFPKGIKVYTSLDGKNFELSKEISVPPTPSEALTELKFFEIDIEPKVSKFLKVNLISTLKNPDWHPSAGEECWLFVDEILVE